MPPSASPSFASRRRWSDARAATPEEDQLDDDAQQYVRRWFDDNRTVYNENLVSGSEEMVAVIQKSNPELCSRASGGHGVARTDTERVGDEAATDFNGVCTR